MDTLNIFFNTLKGELFLKERELETLINSKEYDYTKLKNILTDCSELKNMISVFDEYININSNK